MGIPAQLFWLNLSFGDNAHMVTANNCQSFPLAHRPNSCHRLGSQASYLFSYNSTGHGRGVIYCPEPSANKHGLCSPMG